MPLPESANETPELEFIEAAPPAAAAPSSQPNFEDEIETEDESEEEEIEADDISLTELRDEIAAANAESRRNARRTADVLKQFGGMLTAMSGTLEDLHKTARTTATQATAAAAVESASGSLQRDHALGLIELADRFNRITAAFTRPPAATTSWLPSARKSLTAWQEAWSTQEDAFSILRMHLDDMLRKAGLERLAVAGQPFDPAFMTAVEATADATVPDHTVLAEILPGWRQGATGLILRPAQVRVSRR